MTSRRDFLRLAAVRGVAGLLSAVPSLEAAAQADPPVAAAAPQTREYWIQADSFRWNLVPNGRDDLNSVHYQEDKTSISTVGYRAYTPNWEAPLPADSSIGDNAGIPGPVIRARVGDALVIHFRNNDHSRMWMAHSLHMQGLVGATDDDGFWYDGAPNISGSVMYLGESYTYRYVVPPQAVGAWLYFDASARKFKGGRGMMISRPFLNGPIYSRAKPWDPDELDAPDGAQHGLFGMAIIEDDRTPRVDRENIVILHDFYSDEYNALCQDFDCINGRSFIGNTPTFHSRAGERVRWRVGSIGRENHVFHIHGHRWLSRGQSTDTHLIFPGTTATFDYVEDATGTWLYHCHLTEHMMGGMAGEYVVS
jgi:FtsP/CotA-like multicopper oxidase with cupredoxin domain